MEDLIQKAEDFYKNKHNGRKINWTHNLSTSILNFKNAKGSFELKVNAYQMALLLFWNEKPNEKVPFEALRLATNLTETNLIRTLLSLTKNPKTKDQQILFTDCQPVEPKNFNDSTLFWINQDFVLKKVGLFL